MGVGTGVISGWWRGVEGWMDGGISEEWGRGRGRGERREEREAYAMGSFGRR